MQKLLTIVIPTYNMQDYLHQCLDSLVLSDADLMMQLEVLVINDGSKDKSSAIAHEYEAKYPNTFRVIDKENGNYGSCINRALKEAQGKYIKVLDADDWFDTDEFTKYLISLQQMKADMVLTPYEIHNEHSGEKYVISQPQLEEGKESNFNSYPQEKIFRYSMHMITYRTDLLRSINYCQTEGISYTDTEWTHIPQYAIKTFVWINAPVYQYRIGREGQTMDEKVLAQNIWKYGTICVSLISNAAKYPNKEQYALAEELNTQHIVFLASNIYRRFLVLQKPSKEEIEDLKRFDAYLKSAHPIAYSRCGKLPLKQWLPLHYVELWRKTGIRMPIDLLRETYRTIRYGKRNQK